MSGFDKETKKLIKDRDNHTCQFPGCHRTSNLTCHHIIKRSFALKVLGWSTTQTNSKENGITICRRCHQNLHRNNTWVQYAELFKRIISH